MNEFLDIISHGKRLQSATKPMTVEEIEQAIFKLQRIVEVRKEKEAKQVAENAEKQRKMEEIRKAMVDAGIDLSELEKLTGNKVGRKRGPRPVKYILVDDEGTEHKWTGVGRTPRVFQQIVAEGRLQQYEIAKVEDEDAAE